MYTKYNYGTKVFLGVEKNFRLLIQSCRFFCFFSLDLFMKISNFSKTVHTIFIKFSSHSTPKKAPAFSKASKSYDLNVRNIAKFSPKMAKNSTKTVIFRLFSIFSKTVYTIRTKLSTVILHHIRVLYVQWHQNRMAGMWETWPKLSQKWPKNSQFSFFFRFSQNCQYHSKEIFYSHSSPYYGPLCAISLNSYDWDVRIIAKINPKSAKKQLFFDFFWFSQKLSIRFERTFVQSF